MQAVSVARSEARALSCGIVADRTFILATRDAGYRDVAAAVSELIDNSVQADAHLVNVFLYDARDKAKRDVTIAVLDDGCGMSATNLRTALQFGGSERFGDRTGLGRFGMGLPNSSVSQARRVEVYTWRSAGDVLFTYLDVDEVAAGILTDIPAPTHRALPDWCSAEAGATGTLVLWTGCDRIGRYRIETLVERLCAQLGRTYRYALWNGLRIQVNSVAVGAIDPLFVDSRARHHGAVPYGAPLRFEIANLDTTSSVVEARFTELPIEDWYRWSTIDKRRAGVVGAPSVSVVRAGREIDSGWHLMGGKRRENYDDWWRCEIRFSPDLDELFGVTHNKQGINPSLELRAILGSDLEGIARTLNARVRTRFECLKEKTVSDAVRQACDVDQFLTPPRNRRHVGLRGLQYRLDSAPLPGPEFFHVRLAESTAVVTLNSDHPFYTQVYARTATNPGIAQPYVLECVVLAAARAELEMGGAHRDVIERFQRSWSDTLAAFLDS